MQILRVSAAVLCRLPPTAASRFYSCAAAACTAACHCRLCLLLQLTDAAFSAVFSGTMPALQQVSLAGCPGISDTALQLLTASCRRLSSISISSCRQLSDKTLKRLAHCERLGCVVLKGCRGFSAEGVAALAAAPQMKQVSVNGCMGVRSSLCKGYRPGVKVRVEDRL